MQRRLLLYGKEKKMFKKLFEPIRIKRLEIKNRIAMAPMYAAGLTEPNGAYSQRAIDYYEERTRGGTGLRVANSI